MDRRRAVRLAIRILGILAGSLIGLIVLALVLLQFRGVRDNVLEFALERVAAVLPGELTVGESAWPELGDLDFRGVYWRDEAGSLASADHIFVSMKIGDLRKRDLAARDVMVEGGSANIPRIIAALSSDAGEPGDTEPGEPSDPSFPRKGVPPWLPSLAVESFSITARDVVLPDSTIIDTVGIAGSLDVTPDRGPLVTIDHLVAASRAEGWSIDHTELRLESGWVIGGESRGMLGEGWPFRLDLDGNLDGEFTLTLLLGEEGAFSDPFGIRVRGQFGLADSRIETVDYTADIGLPAIEELARLPLLDKVLAGWPLLGATRATLEGTLVVRPEFSADAHLLVQPGDWIEHAEARIRYAQETLVVDTLDLDLPDLQLDASGSLGEEISALALATVTGTSWLEILGVDFPADSAALELEASMSGTTSEPEGSARLTGGLMLSGTRVEEIDLRLRAPGFIDQPINASFTARAYETWARLDLGLTLGDVIEVTATPLSITAGPSASDLALDHSARIAFEPATKRLTVRDFEIRGDQGDVTLGASVTDFRNGEATVVARWDSPPYIIDHFMGTGTVDSLRFRWSERGPFDVTVQAEFEDDAGGRLIDLRGDVALPGPATLSHYLPEGAAVDSLGPLYSEFSIALNVNDDGVSYEADLDPSRTDWIDSAELHVQGGTGSLHIRDAHLEAMGVRISADGGQKNGVWDMAGRLDLTSARLLQVLSPSVGPDATTTLTADMTMQGTAEQPDISASVTGGALTDIVSFEEINGEVTWGRRGLSVLVDLPRGMKIPVLLDSVSISYESPNSNLDPFPGVLEMDAAGPRIRLAQTLRIDRTPDWVVIADTLGLGIPEGDLGSDRPFRVEFLEEAGAIVIEDMAFSGSLGRLTASGYADPDSSNIEADISLAIPQEPRSRFPAPGLWPERVDVEVRSDEEGALLVAASATGLEMSGWEGVGARLNLAARSEVTELDLVIEDESTIFADVDLRVPAHFDVYPPGWSPREGPLSGTVSINNLQVSWDRLVPGSIPEKVLTVEGGVELAGTARNPTMKSDLTARLPEDPSHPDYVVHFESRFETAGGDSIASRSSALSAVARLDRGDTIVLTANLEFPLGILGESGRPDSTRTIDLDIESEPLLLEELNPLLPTDYTLSGSVELDLTAKGRLDDPDIDGSLVASNAGIRIARGGNASGHADIGFSGTGLRPRIEGSVDVIGGVIPIPENRREILPHEGQSMLWEVQGLPPLTAVPIDTLASPVEEASTVKPDIDVTIRVPASLWVRGRQMDVELAGDLDVVYRDGAPTIIGTLRTKGGRFIFLGRTFTPERGEVTFFGDDESNPSLDIRMTSRVEQYEIIVTVTRTVLEPDLKLSSVPELEQADIMSVLTFGKTSADLDGDQLELAAQRAAQMAAAWGAAEVSGSLTDPLGVDMLGYNPSGRDGQSTIYVGKWLSPRALLKYEQALESGAGFFVTLEYSLDHWVRNLRLETLVGTRQSGAEISWSRDY